MFKASSEPPTPLPSIQFEELAPGVGLLLPLSRRGHGPGLIILTPDTTTHLNIIEAVPSPLIKWAEEGYAVVEIQQQALSAAVIKQAIEALSRCDRCDANSKIGLISYDPQLWNLAASMLKDSPAIVAAVNYANAVHESELAPSPVPILHHLAGNALGQSREKIVYSNTVAYYYPGINSYTFATPFQPDFKYTTEAISHSRSLQHLKTHMGGPYFDLETIWDEHTYYEFTDRSVEHTMSTMVQEPYVNHVPTMTGGVGRERLTEFYRNHFIFQNSPDTENELVSRSIGIDRVIDEFIFKFTHDREIDWLLPGVPPTGLKAEVPFMAVVNIRGDRLYHEHIIWDQGTLLRQLGLLPEYLPFPYPFASGTAGRQVEYRVPVTGIDTARKLRDRNSLAANEMFGYKVRTI